MVERGEARLIYKAGSFTKIIGIQYVDLQRLAKQSRPAITPTEMERNALYAAGLSLEMPARAASHLMEELAGKIAAWRSDFRFA